MSFTFIERVQKFARWVVERVYFIAEDAALAVLAAGPIPKHIAFVMDGNRRYARQQHKAIQQGHADGYVALERMIEICVKLNIRCVSAYAFAIENFKRSKEEVDALMDLAEAKLLDLCEKGSILDKHGVRLHVLGRRGLFPQRVQVAIRKAEEMSRHNDRVILNLCMPYGARDEITTAIESTVREALRERREPRTISEADIESHLLTSVGRSPPLDILIRTSGVKRLSDFLLWQCCENTQLQFTSTYWPNFGLWDFVPIILDYQRKVWSSSSAHKRVFRKGNKRL
ncbi:hypothetical protein JAAARDRAFT_191362 [Jaapia argillacea MUCL 33604]|uniref:Alkyl transferase n=1 Tax=Jaapia argillacea MUCL 33604 TaxID=933084 RepID=A0A067Q2H6_9AGAM|nr:hypothetical protein JAAARDRAFT_191362 [Jaapia argillacea MUCL 33604]